ncbi:MAG TPA: hypothetical protein VIC26_10595 [Marinagarivorans sp.]
MGLVFILLLLVAPVAKASSWHVYESDNFRIVADKKRKDAKTQLHDLELFRQAAVLFTGLTQEAEKQRLTIVILEKSRNYLKVFSEKKAAGFYINSMFGPYMVVGPSDSAENTAITLRHEYVHHLLHSSSSTHYPRWYDEGISDLLSTARVSANSVAIGAPHPWRRAQLGYGHVMGFSDLLVPANFFKDDYYGSLYYSTAWLAVHYFLLGELNGVNLQGANINRYLAGYARGIRSHLDFEKLIGQDFATLNLALKQYAQRQELAGFRLPVQPYRGGFSGSRLSDNQQRIEFGLVALAAGRWQVATEISSKIKKAEGAQLLRALNTLAKAQLGDASLAAELNSHSEPDDPLAKILLAAAMLREAQEQDNNAQSLNKAERLAREGLVAYPHNLYAREVLWRAAQIEEDLPAATEQLLLAHQYFPANVWVNFLLGQVLLARGQLSEARLYLNNVVLWSHDRDMAMQAMALLQQIDADVKSEEP